MEQQQQQSKRFSIPVPLIGDTVWYYRRGQTNRQPIPAIVTDNDRCGILELSLIVPMARTIEPASSVRHRSDPYLKTHQNVAEEQGVWDFVGGGQGDVAGGPAGKTLTEEEIKQKVLELYETCEHDASRVAEEMTKLVGEFSYQRVNAIVRYADKR